MADGDGFSPVTFFDFASVPSGDLASSFDIFSLPAPAQNGAVQTPAGGAGSDGFFDRVGSAFGGIFDLLGSGIEAVGSLDATSRQVTGKGVLPDRRAAAAPARQATFATAGISLPMVALIALGGVAIFAATR